MRKLLTAVFCTAVLGTAFAAAPASAGGRDHDVRFATYNLSLNRPANVCGCGSPLLARKRKGVT